MGQYRHFSDGAFPIPSARCRSFPVIRGHLGPHVVTMAPRRVDWRSEGAWLCMLLLLALTAASDAAARAKMVEDEQMKPGCPSCGMPHALEPEAERQIMAELAKQQILSKLHLKERPNITHPVPRLAVANALRRLHPGRGGLEGLLGTPHWDNQGDGPAEDQGYEIISFADSDFSNSANGRLTFQFTRDSGQSVHILHAHLWLFFKSHRVGKSNLTARLYLSGPGQAERSLVGERHLEVGWSGWHTFSLTPTLQGFFDRQDKGLHLELECDGCHEATATVNASDAHQPFLVAQASVRDAPHHVAKRSLNCDKNSKLCCRKNYYVDFKDIGWNDWIIKPEGYQINYCMGLCPMHIAGAPGMAASFHTAVLNLIKANNINTSTSSCCVPTKHRPLSMLYYDKNHNIVKTDIPDMIVEACGCS